MDAVIESTLNQVQPHTRAFVALSDILDRGKFSKSHVYNMMARGHFPPPVLRMGPRFTRWSSEQVDLFFADPAAWIAANAKEAGWSKQAPPQRGQCSYPDTRVPQKKEINLIDADFNDRDSGRNALREVKE